jgi:hypothetical protein
MHQIIVNDIVPQMEDDLDPFEFLKWAILTPVICIEAIPRSDHTMRLVADIYVRLLKNVIASPNNV